MLSKILKFFGGLLFSSFLFFSFLNLSLIQFTNYQNLKENLMPVIKDMISLQIKPEQLNNLRIALLKGCENLESLPIQIGIYNVNLNCKDIRESKIEGFDEFLANALFDSLYYKKYDCDFISCLRQGDVNNLLIIFSYQGNNFFKLSIYFTLLFTILGLIMILISIKDFRARFSFLGWNILFATLPIIILPFGIDYLKILFLPKITQELNLESIITNIVLKIFTQNIAIVITFFALGIVLITISMLSKKSIRKTKKS